MTKRNIPVRSDEDDERGQEAQEAKETAPDASVESPERPPSEGSRSAGSEEQIAELTDRLQRLAAEFENYKKKNAQEFARGRLAGFAVLFERLLPVLDAFDSAVAVPHNADADSAYAEGFKKIRELMIETLIGAGLEIIEPRPGEKFDPNLHEVLFCENTDQQPDQTVFATLQRGYFFGGFLIRPAKIQLAVKPEETCDA